MVLKKGQVTIFIIIGIILVLSIGIFIYLYQTEVIRPFEEVIVPSIEKAPSEVQPIQDYVTSCVEVVGKDALKRIGDHGGYTDTSGLLFNPFVPTEGEAVQFSPDSDMIVPYWWYLESPNDCRGECQFSSLRPELHRRSGKMTIAGQIDEYVNDNLKECLAGFAPFTAQNFEIKELGDVSTETTIAKDNVFIVVNYPIRITRAGQIFTIKEYLAQYDLNLGKIYDLATDLVNLEAEHGVLEHFTMELVHHFADLDKDMLPPPRDFEVKFGPGIFWFRSKVADALQEIITSYTPLLQIANTRLYKPIIAPEGVKNKELFENLYNRGMIVPLEKNYQDLAASFVYLPWWEMYFDANCEGEVCQPQSVNTASMILQIGLHKYDFMYDVSYPVLVEIRDPDAFKGEGYSFKYFIETNVRHNLPMPAEYEPLQPYELDFNSMLCDEQQKTSGNVTILVKDKVTGKGVDHALVGYTCGKESCTVGMSVNGTLVARLPRCINGMLSADKKEYLTAFEPLDVIDDRDLNATVLIEPYRYVDFTVKKYTLGKGARSWSLNSNKTLIQAQDEDTIIMLRRYSSRTEPSFSAYGEVCGSPTAKAAAACGSPPTDNSEHIPIVPGRYHVSIFSVKYPMPPVIIPKDKRAAGSGLLREEYYLPDKDIVFDAENPYPYGFADFEWNLTAQQLDSGDTVEFKYIGFALDKVPKNRRKIEDLTEMGKTKDYSDMYKGMLEPRVFRRPREGVHTITIENE